MALTKDKKADVITQVGELLDGSKLTVIAQYSGTSVKSLQQLRAQASENGTMIRVVKNRLFKKILEGNDKYSQVDTSLLNGQLLYAFNDNDEVAPAQSLASFAKNEPQIVFIGGIDADGRLLSAEDIKALANLPSREELKAQLVGTIAAPLSGFVNVMAGNVRGLLNTLNARSEQIN